MSETQTKTLDKVNYFERGDRAYLDNAYIIRERRGDVLFGNIYDDTRALQQDGEKIFTSHVIGEIYDDVFLTKNGMTYFVRSWKEDQAKDSDTIN